MKFLSVAIIYIATLHYMFVLNKQHDRTAQILVFCASIALSLACLREGNQKQ